MKHRTWILEALRLHFEEKLSRIEAGRRPGIPKTTVCDLFVRFRKSGLSWPLSDRVTPRNLDKRLYRQSTRKATVLPVVPAPIETLAVSRRPRRPNFPRDFKIALVERSMQPGVNVAQLARENNINDNLLFNWRRLYQQGQLVARTEVPLMLPVTLAAESGHGQAPPSPTQGDETPCCELVLPAGTLRITACSRCGWRRTPAKSTGLRRRSLNFSACSSIKAQKNCVRKRHVKYARQRSASVPCRRRWRRCWVNSMTRYTRSRCASLPPVSRFLPHFPAKSARCFRQKPPVTTKFAEHTPHYRQSEIYRRQGVELSRATLGR